MIEVTATVSTVNLTVDLISPTVRVDALAPTTVNVPMVGATIGIPGPGGPSGPAGPVGMVKVTHGSDATVVRPAVPVVYWVGTVTPLNADPDDLLMLKGT